MDTIGKGAYPLIKRYEGSLIKALITVYPEHNWKEWRFTNVPRNYWKDINHQRKYLDWLGNELQIHKYENWYDVNISGIGTLFQSNAS